MAPSGERCQNGQAGCFSGSWFCDWMALRRISTMGSSASSPLSGTTRAARNVLSGSSTSARPMSASSAYPMAFGHSTSRAATECSAVEGQLDLDVAARGARVGAHLVRRLHEGVALVRREPDQPAAQLDRQLVRALGGLAERDARRDRGPVAERPLLHARHQPQRALVAGGIPGGEQLLGVGAGAARAAE